MNRFRLLLALVSAIFAPGTGIGLLCDALEGLRLYLCYRVFFALFQDQQLFEHPPWWAGISLMWGMWAILDVANVIYRWRKGEVLPDEGKNAPTSLRWLAGLLTVMGLFTTVTVLPGLNKLNWFIPQSFSWVGPFSIIIADRLLRRRKGWRTFTMVLIIWDLGILLAMFTLQALGYITITDRLSGKGYDLSLRFWMLLSAQISFYIATLAVLFLPKNREYFRAKDTNIGVIANEMPSL